MPPVPSVQRHALYTALQFQPVTPVSVSAKATNILAPRCMNQHPTINLAPQLLRPIQATDHVKPVRMILHGIPISARYSNLTRRIVRVELD